MQTQPPVIETIVLKPDPTLPPSLLSNIEQGFADAFKKAEELRQQALAIVVSDPKDFKTMKEARKLRLELKEVRVNGEHTRKRLKEDSLRMGKAIDGINNVLVAAIAPLEAYLQTQEDFAALYAAEQKARITAERTADLQPYLREGAPLPDLSTMDDAQWTAYVKDQKLLHEARINEDRKAEAERIAAEQAAAAEKVRLQVENDRLKAEAAEAQKAADAAAAERKKLEEQARSEIAEANAALAKEKAAREKIEAEAKAKADAAAAEAAKKTKAEAAATRKAARAPDSAKLNARIAAYLAIADTTIIMSTEDGQALLSELTEAVAAICNRVGTKLNAAE